VKSSGQYDSHIARYSSHPQSYCPLLFTPTWATPLIHHAIFHCSSMLPGYKWSKNHSLSLGYRPQIWMVLDHKSLATGLLLLLLYLHTVSTYQELFHCMNTAFLVEADSQTCIGVHLDTARCCVVVLCTPHPYLPPFPILHPAPSSSPVLLRAV